MPNISDLVLQMQQQGMSNNQIVQNLQQQGFKSHEIFDAMNQSSAQTGGPIDQGAPPAPSQGLLGRMAHMPPSGPPPAMPPPPPGPQSDDDEFSGIDTDKIEEIAESIIEEKWTDLIKNVNKIVEWKDKTESRLTKLETSFDNLKSGFDQLHQGVLGKITEYEKGITNLGTEIKALEQVFQKILPTLTENVNELSRITKKLKPSPISKKSV